MTVAKQGSQNHWQQDLTSRQLRETTTSKNLQRKAGGTGRGVEEGVGSNNTEQFPQKGPYIGTGVEYLGSLRKERAVGGDI